jgi:AcrR family transcriptional regulator
MPRTQNPQAHATRRDSFVDTTQTLMLSKGYEQLSIQEILDTLGVSKGAFYHYFDSKQALLEAVVERMVDTIMTTQAEVVANPEISAPEKIRSLFSGISQYKNARRELRVGILEVWLSDDNAIVREKMRRATSFRLTPILALILRQGKEEGVFTVESPEHDAAVLVSIILGLNEKATQLYVDRQAGRITFQEVELAITSYVGAFERLIGVPAGSVLLVDQATVRQWFA